jgi:hypothetical protein
VVRKQQSTEYFDEFAAGGKPSANMCAEVGCGMPAPADPAAHAWESFADLPGQVYCPSHAPGARRFVQKHGGQVGEIEYRKRKIREYQKALSDGIFEDYRRQLKKQGRREGWPHEQLMREIRKADQAEHKLYRLIDGHKKLIDAQNANFEKQKGRRASAKAMETPWAVCGTGEAEDIPASADDLARVNWWINGGETPPDIAARSDPCIDAVAARRAVFDANPDPLAQYR